MTTALSLKPLSNVTTPWENRRGARATCLEEEETTLKLLSEVKCNERILLTPEHSKLS